MCAWTASATLRCAFLRSRVCAELFPARPSARSAQTQTRRCSRIASLTFMSMTMTGRSRNCATSFLNKATRVLSSPPRKLRGTSSAEFRPHHGEPDFGTDCKSLSSHCGSEASSLRPCIVRPRGPRRPNMKLQCCIVSPKHSVPARRQFVPRRFVDPPLHRQPSRKILERCE